MRKKYEKVGLRAIVGVVVFTIVVLGGILFIQRRLTGEETKLTKCKYEKIEFSELADIIENDKSNLRQNIESKTYKILGKYRGGKVYNYKYKLNQWFQTKKVNVALCSFCVKKNDESKWTNDDYNKFKSLYSKGKITVDFLINGSVIEPRFILSTNKKELIVKGGIYYNSLGLKLNKTGSSRFIKEVDIDENRGSEDNKIRFSCPDKCAVNKTLEYKGNNKEYVNKIEINSYGINIELNISKQINEYKKKLEKLKPNENEESVGYDICDSVVIKYKDGNTKQYYTKDLIASNSRVSFQDADMTDEFVSEKQKKAAITVIRDIDIDNVVSVFINNKEYKMR